MRGHTRRQPDGVKPATRQPEKSVQGDVVNLYKGVGCKVWDTSQPFRAAITRGLPDLVVFLSRKQTMWWHETKAEDGKQSEEQAGFENLCELTHQTYLLGGVDVAIAHLKSLGVLAA